MPCKILEIVSPLPVAGTIAASETFSWSDFVDYVHPESVFGTGSGISWEFQAINQQTGQKYTAAVTGPNGSDGPSGSDSPIGDTWPDGYYRIHVVYTDPNGLKHNMEKHPIFWNKSIISWMSYVAPGSFMCGSPADEIGRSSSPAETQHKCTLTSGFYIARTAMTCTFFRALMSDTSVSESNKPITSICWSMFDYQGKFWKQVNSQWTSFYTEDDGYAALSKPTRWCFKSTGRASASDTVGSETTNGVIDQLNQLSAYAVNGYSWILPTEAQWEYACRAGVNTALNSGKNLVKAGEDFNLGEVGWYKDNANALKVVAQLKPNALGLYDMHGNVYEWCLDYNRSYSAAAETDPVGAGPVTASPYRSLRGGYYGSTPSYCRSAGSRSFHRVSNYYAYYGVRPALLPQSTP